MGKREVTLTADLWRALVNIIGQAPVGPTIEEQAKRLSLYEHLETVAKRAEAGDSSPGLFSQGQCLTVIQTLETPGIPYLSRGIRMLWDMKAAFGWTAPDLALYDEEDE